MLDVIYNIFLGFSGKSVIAPLIIIAYLWFDSNILLYALCTLQTSILVNLALKYGFQIPLAATVANKDGFAFPSGHTQNAVAFYGWLFKSSHNLALRVVIIIILTGISLGLVHFAYHNYYDVVAGGCVGVLLICGYAFLLCHCKKQLFFIMVVAINLLLLIYLWWRYGLIKEYACIGYFCLLGMIVTECCLHTSGIVLQQTWQKFSATIFCIILWLSFNQLFTIKMLAGSLALLKWFFIGSSSPFAKYLASKSTALFRKKQLLG